MDPHNQELWCDFPGHLLIKSVSFSAGGHKEKKWCCKLCHTSTEEKEDPGGKVCGAKYSEFSHDLFRELYNEYYEVELTDEQIDNLPQEAYCNIMDESEYHVERECQSAEYVFISKEPMVLDQYGADYINMWHDLQGLKK